MTLIDLPEGSAGINPAPAMVSALTTIWQRVLGRSSIGVNDRFFSVGGTLRLADILFAEIAKEFGRELPSATIYHAPTIPALSALLELPELPKFTPFVELKEGKGLPVLIVHGLAGTVPFFGLAQHIHTEHPVFGIQAKGVDGLEQPLQSIDDMASLYLDSLKEFQPRGPYFLVGYSFGGLVALEMAQRMVQRGDQVALLAFIDAYPHPRYLAPGQILALLVRRVIRKISVMKRKYERQKRAPEVRIAGNSLPQSALSFEEATAKVKESAYVALGRYRPRFYDGKIKFIKSESDAYYPANPVPVWVKLAAGFEFETVPGGHLDMLTTDYDKLAAVLTRFLKDATFPE